MENNKLTADEKLIAELMPRKFNKLGVIWVALLSVICVFGLYAYILQLRYGLVVTGLRDYASWGIYISNFEFFVSISIVAALFTAILRLFNVNWATPITRIAEIIAFSGILFGAIIIIVDMGRPERFYNLFIFGRLQSPILWDVIVICTYLCVSVILLYIPLMPDLKLLIERKPKAVAFLHGIYKFFGSFWTGSKEQEKVANNSVNILCVAMVPVALIVKSVTSWLFATTFRTGWDSNNFGAYFISGAFLVGAGCVVVAMYIYRKYWGLEKYITDMHFDKMGRILVLLALIYGYFNINEYMLPFFKVKKEEEILLNSLFSGSYAVAFWSAIIGGMIIPTVIMLFKNGRKPVPMFICGLLIVTGAWIKRYLIVTPTMLLPFLPMHNVPPAYTHYYPTWQEWAIDIATLAGALLVVTLFTRFFPILPIQELINESHEKDNK